MARKDYKEQKYKTFKSSNGNKITVYPTISEPSQQKTVRDKNGNIDFNKGVWKNEKPKLYYSPQEQYRQNRRYL